MIEFQQYCLTRLMSCANQNKRDSHNAIIGVCGRPLKRLSHHHLQPPSNLIKSHDLCDPRSTRSVHPFHPGLTNARFSESPLPQIYISNQSPFSGHDSICPGKPETMSLTVKGDRTPNSG
ncbi:GQ68_01848T0 [Komagataella phaffii GS115]|nr:GQ68_01848T0 [Komagataella phaffii GS115]